jgi:hypothetical protein
MQKTIPKSNRRMGRDYRNVQKASRLKKSHRKKLKKLMQKR